MKKLFIITAVFLFILSGCTQKTETAKEEEPPVITEKDIIKTADNRRVIVCCICSYIAFSIVFAVRCVKHCLLFAEISFGIIRKKDIKFFDATFLLRRW